MIKAVVMRVLWFADNPCGSIRRAAGKVTSCSWFIPLEDEIKKNPGIELVVAYLSNKNERPFRYGGTQYSPIYNGYSLNPLKRLLKRYFHKDNDKMAEQYVSVINTYKPDIIHIHGTESNFAVISKYITDIPIVVSIQGILSPLSIKYFSGIPKNMAFSSDTLYERIRKVGFKNNYNLFLARAARERENLKSVKYIIGRTTWDYSVTGLLSPNREYFHSDECMRESFYHNEWKGKISEGTVALVTTASPPVYKGFETILGAAGLLKERGLRFEWHIIGNIPEKVRSLSEKYTGFKSEECSLIFHGVLDENKICELLKESDIYIQTSHIENSPNSLCEAMLLGVPSIASYVGGTPSLLEDGMTGLFYQDGEIFSLAGRICELVNNPDIAVSLGRSAREIALKRHDRKGIAQKLVEIYSEIIDSYVNE